MHSSHFEYCTDKIAQCVLSAYDKLLAKYKPLRQQDGIQEWVPLAGIVLCKNGHEPVCISACTGMKSLPYAKIQHAQGRILHDCHAEVLAIRAFNACLLRACSALVDGHELMPGLLRHRTGAEQSSSAPQVFAVCDDVQLYMYCSEVPCGDASMELIMESQADATPWPAPSIEEEQLKGRGNFDQLGIVRRKPARPDAPLCLSKSCTDKLTLKQCTSLLSSVTVDLIHPGNAYLHGIVVPASKCRPASFERAFGAGGRLAPFLQHASSAHWDEAGFAFRPFKYMTTSASFAYSRAGVYDKSKLKPSNKCAIYAPAFQEVVVNGIVQGRKAGDAAAASTLSRLRMWTAVNEVEFAVNKNDENWQLGKHEPVLKTYYNFKRGEGAAKMRRRVKQDVIAALGSWPPNAVDDFEILQK